MEPSCRRGLQKTQDGFHLSTHSQVSRPLTVEVDGLEMGIGGVLPQHFREKPKLHPVFFFFSSSPKKLTPAKQNYAIRHRELLAIKLDLEEWRHWFEGAAHPFIILTAHKKTIKRLNPSKLYGLTSFFQIQIFHFIPSRFKEH